MAERACRVGTVPSAVAPGQTHNPSGLRGGDPALPRSVLSDLAQSYRTSPVTIGDFGLSVGFSFGFFSADLAMNLFLVHQTTTSNVTSAGKTKAKVTALISETWDCSVNLSSAEFFGEPC
jgi:hypothetical protein